MKFLSHFVQRFRRLQWKLTLFYILTTMVVLIVLEMAGFLIMFGIAKYNVRQTLAYEVGVVAQNVGSNFTGPFINRNRLYEALRDWRLENGTEFQGFSAVVDPEGQLIAVAGEHWAEAGGFGAGLPASVQRHIRTALALEPGIDGIEATRQVKQVSPRSQVIVLTSYHEDEHIFPACVAARVVQEIRDTRRTDDNPFSCRISSCA
ncbi:hypothetical protein [Paenibacillus elgii]|uniref:hypothetical protein n=1 Tax=Paenibacillus elgii TaxID=189691 RepID=UPI00203F2933|nr:hypothetical protein [Paenibacillus elgii]MCM3271646.1 hypothetical protein [Paenibacillus elgii]